MSIKHKIQTKYFLLEIDVQLIYYFRTSLVRELVHIV